VHPAAFNKLGSFETFDSLINKRNKLRENLIKSGFPPGSMQVFWQNSPQNFLHESFCRFLQGQITIRRPARSLAPVGSC